MTLLVYSYGLNTRRYLWLFLIWMFTVMAFAVSEYVQIGFITMAVIFFLILLIDYMFINEKAFKYDPDYTNWVRQNTPAYY